MFDVVCFGGATQDNFIRIAQSETQILEDPKTKRELLAFEHNAKIPVEEAVSFTGGGAMNTACAYKLLGMEPALVTAIGTDAFGANIEAQLTEKNISQDYVVKLTGVHTAFSTILTTAHGDRTVFVYRGASDHLSKDIIPHLGHLKRAKWISLSNLSGKSDKLVPEIFALKKKNPSVQIAWNPGRTQLEKGLLILEPFLQRTRVLMLNREEAEMLTKTLPVKRDEQEVLEMAKKIADYGADIIVITDSALGSFAYSDHVWYVANTIPSKTTNTTGAGDAFFAGFVAGLHMSRGEVDVALSFGSANAAGAIEIFGAQNGLLTVQEIQERIQNSSTFTIRRRNA